MFKHPRGLFSSIECPQSRQNEPCTIVNCIFSHKSHSKRPPAENANETPTKRAKLETPATASTETTTPVKPVVDSKLLIAQDVLNSVIPRPLRSQQLRKIAHQYTQQGDATPNKSAMAKEAVFAETFANETGYLRAVAQFCGGLGDATSGEAPVSDAKVVMPKVMPQGAPAMLPARKKFIEKFIETIKKVDPQCPTPITDAIEMEFEVASVAKTGTYPQLIRRRLHELSTGKQKAVKKPLTKQQVLQGLSEYLIAAPTLKKFGYIMETPQKIDHPAYQRTCSRCETKFLMKYQLEPTKCLFHSGKIKRRERERFYECCGGVIGDAGTVPCQEATHHVFRWDSPEELHHAIPFMDTSTWNNPDAFKALGVDCEMGFTTQGFEMLRLTAVDFFSGETVLDIMTKPFGEVIDLNTQWSGVAEVPDDAMTFYGAIELLKTIMDRHTILVGHGLENDVRTMRLIHHRVVDTAILFPPLQPTPQRRWSLKDLSFQYLARRIQGAEHDSAEDALAAIDIIKYFIKKNFK
ncbi:RNA exonuclease 3 [Diutina catenulata]